MKSSDRVVVIGIGVLGLLAALWFLAISPKRAEVATLDDEISTLEASISEQEQLISAAGAAKQSYRKDYQKLVVLGKAVPADDDAASLIDQTQTIADRAGVDFRGITLGASSGEAAESTAVAPTPPATPAPADAATEGVPAAADAAAAAAAGTPVAATEAAAALLPIGATVGPAGLPVMPYELAFKGDFFEVADFIAGIDSMVRTKSKGIGIDGRLLTVDGFTLAGDTEKGFPELQVTMQVTSYVAPADQGLVGGATEATPAAVPPAATTAPAATTPTATATP